MNTEKKTWYWRNRQKVLAYYKVWVEKNRAKKLAINRAWKRKNPEKVVAHENCRRTRLSGAGGSYTSSEWKQLCGKFKHRCLCCGRKRPLTADHVIPVSKGGHSNISNIQPLCQPCNSSKNNGHTDYRRKPHPNCC